MCCQCEPVVATMVRVRLWPASPHRPHLAFTFELLDWAEALLLECQVSLMDFCKALCLKCPHLVVNVYLHNDNIPATLLLCLHLLLEKGILFIHDRCIRRIQVHNIYVADVCHNFVFRCMKVEIRNSSFVPSLNYGNVCPACPKVRLKMK